MLHTDPIVAAFDALGRRDPSALLATSGSRRATAAGIDALARAAARALLEARPEPGEPVGLIAANGPGFLAGLIACRRAGHPTALLHPAAAPGEIDRAVAAFGLQAILRAASRWPRGGSGFRVQRRRPPADPAGRPPAGTAIIKMTSGSTGAPRGVSVTAQALLADDAALRRAMGIGRDDRLLAVVPFSHSYGLSSLVLPAITSGVTLVLPSSDHPLAPLRAATRHAATVLPTAPAWIAAILRLSEAPPWPASLRLVIAAGAPLRPDTAADFRAIHGRPIHSFYGATECGGICYDPIGEATLRGLVGSPLPGVEVALADVEGEGPSAAKRVVVRSAAVGLAILPRPDPHLSGGRFISSDLASWSGPDLRLEGRLDDRINFRGHKIDPIEVEQAIAGLAGVEEVVVHGLPDGRGDTARLRAVVSAPGGTVTAPGVIAWCRDRLAGYKVPRSVLIVPSMPRTARGKIDRRLATRLAADGGGAHD